MSFSIFNISSLVKSFILLMLEEEDAIMHPSSPIFKIIMLLFLLIFTISSIFTYLSLYFFNKVPWLIFKDKTINIKIIGIHINIFSK